MSNIAFIRDNYKLPPVYEMACYKRDSHHIKEVIVWQAGMLGTFMSTLYNPTFSSQCPVSLQPSPTLPTDVYSPRPIAPTKDVNK